MKLFQPAPINVSLRFWMCRFLTLIMLVGFRLVFPIEADMAMAYKGAPLVCPERPVSVQAFINRLAPYSGDSTATY